MTLSSFVSELINFSTFLNVVSASCTIYLKVKITIRLIVCNTSCWLHHCCWLKWRITYHFPLVFVFCNVFIVSTFVLSRLSMSITFVRKWRVRFLPKCFSYIRDYTIWWFASCMNKVNTNEITYYFDNF